MIYYIIIVLFLGLALAFGRRAGCHYVCWMASFMIIGWADNDIGQQRNSPARFCVYCVGPYI